MVKEGPELLVNNIFASIDGEVNHFGQGTLTTFVRFSGCNMKPHCKFCDTPQAQDISDENSYVKAGVFDIMKKVHQFGLKKVTITGGEPLDQKWPALSFLLDMLKRTGYKISMETNGSIGMPYDMLDSIDSVVADYKLTSSGVKDKMHEGLFSILRKTDFVKFVITSQTDLAEALAIRESVLVNTKARIAYSPATIISCSPAIETEVSIPGMWFAVDPQWLVDEVIKYGRGDESINLQIHKWRDSGNRGISE